MWVYDGVGGRGQSLSKDGTDLGHLRAIDRAVSAAGSATTDIHPWAEQRIFATSSAWVMWVLHSWFKLAWATFDGQRPEQEAPTEIIIAVIASTLTFLFVPTAIPFFHRFGRRTQRRMLLSLGLLTAGMILIFASRNAYDAQHPKRIGVQYVHNVTSGDNHLHIAQMDRGPGFPDLLSRLHTRYGHAHRPLTPNPREGDNSDWDILYPISAFLETEMFELGVSEGNPGRELPEVQVEVVADAWEADEGVRRVTLAVEHVCGAAEGRIARS